MFKRIASFLARKVIISTVKALTLETVGEVVQGVERRSNEALAKWSGEEKKDAAIRVLMSRLDIPYMSDAQEKVLWGLVIDMVVGLFNTYVWSKIK